ncbi:TIGR03084 family metal-binding protein [Blastomonas sp. AAP53]|uniref:TIGR03084 family metal-binding protein n=1 Tax=Blastomonas sp. AAP53 TaxID=1248760 RepID=UPI0002EAF106|nr:TIGR03084 family metal-binding protein [Blastomonas sp. AAP53]
MQQATDFLTECDRIHALVAPLDEAQLATPTAFKGWTIADIIGHLHVWNQAAQLSLNDEAAFKAFMAQVGGIIAKGGDLNSFERVWLDGLTGQALVAAWAETCRATTADFATADPAQRVPWAGPSMSARSSITARLMESWAHAQAIFDVLGTERTNGDGLKNICVLGLNTYGWTFKNRRMEAPQPAPYLVLTAPSGEIWTFGEPADGELIEGDAAEFCQVVTQTRNIADTALKVTGPNATAWMAIAQCFAGAPVDPPAPGVRRKLSA